MQTHKMHEKSQFINRLYLLLLTWQKLARQILQMEKMFRVEKVKLPVLVCVASRARSQCSSSYESWLAEVIKLQCSIPALHSVWCVCVSASSVNFLSSWGSQWSGCPSQQTYPPVTSSNHKYGWKYIIFNSYVHLFYWQSCWLLSLNTINVMIN